MPPRFCNVVVSEDRSISPREKTCAEGIHLKRRPGPAYGELCHPFIVNVWLTVGVDRHLERLSGLFIHESHHDVQQAHAGPISVNNGLGDLVFLF